MYSILKENIICNGQSVYICLASIANSQGKNLEEIACSVCLHFVYEVNS